MTKKEYVAAIAEKCEYTHKAVNEMLDAINEVVKDNLSEGEIPLIDGLKLTTAYKPARTMRNPQNGEPINVPAKVIPKAKIGKRLKDIVQK